MMGAQANVYANGANMTILAETQLHQLTNQWMLFGTQICFYPQRDWIRWRSVLLRRRGSYHLCLMSCTAARSLIGCFCCQ